MTAPIVLNEYESTTTQLPFDQVVALRALVGNRLSITAGDTPADWIIRATCHVGTVVVGSTRILIRPKVSNANLFHLLEAGGEALDIRPEEFEYEKTADLVPSFATFYAHVVENAFGRGIHRAYEEREEALVGIRGRVAMAAQQRRFGLPLPIACQFDEHTSDVPLNRIIKAGAERLNRLRGVTSTTHGALASILGRLEEVSALRGTELRVPTVFSRLNYHYRAAERLARMVLRSTSLVDIAGDAEAGAFLVNMNLVFQDFVESRLRTFLAGRLTVESQHPTWLDSGHRVVRLIPDLVFRAGDEPLFVADTKYKLILDEEKGRNPDYYQLLAYATALNVSEGLLVYCHDDGIVPEPIAVEHLGTRLFVRGIKLNGTPADVDAQLRELAEWIGERSSHRQASAAIM